jgi:hypothetical protein
MKQRVIIHYDTATREMQLETEPKELVTDRMAMYARFGLATEIIIGNGMLHRMQRQAQRIVPASADVLGRIGK